MTNFSWEISHWEIFSSNPACDALRDSPCVESASVALFSASLSCCLSSWISLSAAFSCVRRKRLLRGGRLFRGVGLNTILEINKILKVSISKKVKINNMDKLLISIFRSAIYEILFSNNVTKKIAISEYLLIANRFFGNNETALINGVLDNLQNS